MIRDEDRGFLQKLCLKVELRNLELEVQCQ